jgi:hypothetical protein
MMHDEQNVARKEANVNNLQRSSSDVLSDVLLRAHDLPARTIRMYAKDEFMICSHAMPNAVTLFDKSTRFNLAHMMHIT